jgi:5-methylthioadenosine/S-adenosylhomocysteine deaminase
MTLEKVDLLLTHGLIVTQDDQRTIIADGAVAIKSGRITAVGPNSDIISKYQAAETIDVSEQIIFPGMIDVHTHLFQVATKGLGEDMPVQDWVQAVTAPTAMQITPEEMHTFCLSGCLEHIHCGTTTVVDMSYCAHSYELHEQNIQAMLDSGLRGRYTSIISDFGLEFGIDPRLIQPIEWFVDQYTRLHAQYPANDRMAVWVAIGAPWTITDHGMDATIEYLDQTGTPICMHINENYIDNQLSQKRYGTNIVPQLEKVGLLRPDLLAIHCVFNDEVDNRLFKEHDVKVAYNPVSNMYLGSGVAPIIEMQRMGLTIGLGVDGAGSNNSQDMIETLKAAALLQKVHAADASVVDAQTTFDWATRDAARVIGLEDEIGSLEVGKRADLFTLSLNSAKIVPVHDPVASLVYSAGEQNVKLTIADGKVLMRAGVIQHLDEEKILRECQSSAVQLADRCGSNARLVRAYR